MVGAQPGFTSAIMVNPLATVFAIGDPNLPGFISAPGLGSASAIGFMVTSVRCLRIFRLCLLRVTMSMINDLPCPGWRYLTDVGMTDVGGAS
jgi:hypothetical protein